MNPYIVTMLVTAEQEHVIGTLFHHRGWLFTKTSRSKKSKFVKLL